MKHTDIKADGWIATLPGVLQPYALLMRLDRPIGTWLLLLPCWWSVTLAAGGAQFLTSEDIFLLALFGVGAVIMRGAGCVINDLWDRDLDRQVERTRSRPLASGAVSVTQALWFVAMLFCLGLGILMQMNAAAIMIGVASVAFIVAYPLMKRITWWPQAFLGLTFNFGALIGWAAVMGFLSPPAMLLYASGFFWTLGYDTIYAHQDREDDLRAGIKSSALRLGDESRRWVAGFYGISFILMLLSFLSAHAGWAALAGLTIAGLHLARQIRIWKPGDPRNSLAVFRSNRDFGLIVLAAAAAAGL